MNFNSLSGYERYLLNIAVLLPEKFKKSDLLRISRELKDKSFVQECNSLIELSLLQEYPEDRYFVSDDIYKYSLQDVLFGGEFSKISNYLKYEYLNHNSILTEEEKYAYSRILFYRGVEDIFNKLDEKKRSHFFNKIYSEVRQILTLDFWDRVQIHKKYRKEFINFLLDSILGGFRYEKIHFKFLNENTHLFTQIEKEKYALLLVLRGDKQSISSETELCSLWNSVLVPEFAPIFQSKFFGDYRDFLIFFSILKKGFPENSKILYEFINYIIALKDHPFEYEFSIWKKFLDFLRDDSIEILPLHPEQDNFWRLITFLLIKNWLGLPISTPPPSQDFESDWFHAQIENAYGKTYEFQVGFPLVHLFQKPPEWMLRLDSLSEYLKKFSKSPVLRLHWVLVYDESNRKILTISPQLKEFNSKGWVSVKTPPIASLFNQQDKLSYLSGYDLKILRKVVQKTIDLKGNRVSEIDLEEPEFLEGHPFLMLPDETPLVLKKKEPVLIIETKESIHFELNPEPPSAETYIVIRDSSSVLHLYYFSSELLKIYEFLGNGKKKFPIDAEGRLLPILDSLSRYFSIRAISNLSFSEIPRMEANTKIYAEIIQTNSMYRLNIYTKLVTNLSESFLPFSGNQLLWEKNDGFQYILERNFLKEKNDYEEYINNTGVLHYARSISPFQYEFTNFQNCLLFLSGPGKSSISFSHGQTIEVRGKISFENVFLRTTKEGEFFRLEGRVYLPGNLEITLSSIWEVFLVFNSPRYLEIEQGVFWLFEEPLEARLEEIFLLLQFFRGFAYIPLRAIFYMNELLLDFHSIETDLYWQRLLESFEISTTGPGIEFLNSSPLREYQKKGVIWMLRRLQNDLGVCLADDMGLGKTLQVLYVLKVLLSGGPFLLLLPTSLLSNWEEEAKTHFPDARIVRVEELLKGHVPHAMELFLVPYSYLQNEEFMKRISGIGWEGILLDEAQMIKNSSSKRFKNLSRLKARRKIALTGTPMENHPGELWSIFEFINPGLLGTRELFKNKYEMPIYENKKLNIYSLQKLISPYILRREKKDVLPELPKKEEIIVPIELSSEEREIYEKIRENALELLKDALIPDAQKKVRILSVLMKLRRVCCHRKLLFPDEEYSSEKFQVFTNLLGELLQSKERVLVFSQFTDYLRLIERYLQDENIQYKYLDGTVPRKKRAEAVKDFQLGFGDVFLISLRAGGFGLNLTSASSVVHMDPWWNPAALSQASDRVYRIGQTKPVKIFKLITLRTVEEKILSLHVKKTEIAESILEFTKTENYSNIEVIKQILEEDI